MLCCCCEHVVSFAPDIFPFIFKYDDLSPTHNKMHKMYMRTALVSVGDCTTCLQDLSRRDELQKHANTKPSSSKGIT